MNKTPIKGEFLEVLLRSQKTVFSTKDASLLWNEKDDKIISNRLKKYVKSGKLVRLRRGLYAKSRDYNKNELATKIFTPSYISFETVLGSAGVTFQYYSQIFLASYKTLEIEIDNQKYSFKRIKENILTSNLGINSMGGYSIATIERAFLDVIYFNKQYYFDNLRSINWEKVNQLLPIYGGNKRMETTIKRLKSPIK
jgi:predicted transcriptional regulator of viral defense system